MLVQIDRSVAVFRFRTSLCQRSNLFTENNHSACSSIEFWKLLCKI